MSIWDGYADWDLVAASDDEVYVRSQLVGATPHWRPNFIPAELKAYFAGTGLTTVLDFGCGVGRNAPELRRYFERLIGVDLESMLRWVPPGVYDVLCSSHSVFSPDVPMLLFDSVCLQHIIDLTYAASLAASINASGVRSVVSLTLDGLGCAVTARLQALGWRIVLTLADDSSFCSRHMLNVFERG